VRIGEAKLDEPRALVNRRGRHRGGAGKIADLGHDLRIADKFLGDRHGLAWVRLTVLEHVLQRTSRHASLGIDLFEGKVKSLFPLRPILRVLPRQRAAHADRHRLAGCGLRERLRGGESRQACRENGQPGETDQFERVKRGHRSALSS
jgi:hypothetical protein